MKNSIRIASVLAATMLLPGVTALPALADGQGAQQSDTHSRGYIGEIGRNAIASNAAKRLKNSKMRRISNTADRVYAWHEIALDSVAIDHTPDGPRAPLENGGPTRTSRALAMTQTAVFDAVNSFGGDFEPYNDIGRTLPNASVDAAIAQAAHDVQVALYPGQADRLDALLADDLANIRASAPRIRRGREAGAEAAAAMLARRAGDGSEIPEPQFGEGGAVADGSTTNTGNGVNDGTLAPGEWSPDPVTGDTVALGAFWGAVTPFAIPSGDAFRAPPAPMVTSPEYADAFNEVAPLGGSPDNTGILSTATPETIFIGNYWGYDGVPLIGVPPRLYNQIAAQEIKAEGSNDPAEVARLLAQVSMAQADSGIAAWDSKYFHNYWRPVTGVRSEDGNPATLADPTWEPVGVSVINTNSAIRPTPPFPAYPSGHATFGAAVMEILRDNFGDIAFTFVSDEYDGTGDDPFMPGTPRPLVPVRFDSYTAAQLENGQSRIFNGVHWQFDNGTGQTIGIQVAEAVQSIDAFQPR